MALPMLAFSITCALFLPFARLGIDSHHDGVMLKPALDVLSGQRLFGDTFTQYGALSTYIQVFFLWAMGKTLLSLKVGTVLAYALTASILCLAWRKFLPASLVALSILVCLFLPDFYHYSKLTIMLPWSSAYAMVFQALGLLYLLKTIEGSSGVAPFLCGVSAALVTWCRMPTGVFHTAACVAFLALMLYASSDRRRFAMASAGFLAGLLLVHGLFFAHLWATGSITDWYIQIIRWPAKWAGSLSRPSRQEGLSGLVEVVKSLIRSLFAFANIREGYGIEKFSAGAVVMLAAVAPLVAMVGAPLMRELAGSKGADSPRRIDSWLLVPLLIFSVVVAIFMEPWGLCLWVLAVPVVTLTWTAAATLRYFRMPVRQTGTDGRPVAAVACGLLGLASWMQYFPVSEARHFFWALMPMIGSFVYFLLLVTRGRVVPVTIAMLVLAMPLWVDRASQAVQVARLPFRTIPGDSVLAGMAVPPDEAPRWSALLGAIRGKLEERPDVPMLSEGDDALFGTLVRNHRNPTPFYVQGRGHVDWADLGGRHTADYPRLRDSFRDSLDPIVFMMYDDRESFKIYENRYNYEEFFGDSELNVRLLWRSRPAPSP
jgi:hypothetical protein